MSRRTQRPSLVSAPPRAYDAETFFDLSLDMLCIASTDGLFKKVNPAFERILGWTHEQLLARPFYDLVHPDDLEATRREVGKLAQGIPTISFENRYRCADGSYKSLLWTSQPVGDLVYAVAHDVTRKHQRDLELLEAKEQAEAAARAKAELLAVMSHEIRTPMSGIIGMAELALEGTIEEPLRGQLEVIRHSSELLLLLIHDVLDISKAEAGKLVLLSEPFSLRATVGDAIKIFEVEARRKGLELVVRIDPATPDAVEGDPGRLRQVLLNLAGNALKFTDRGRVTIEVDAGGAAVGSEDGAVPLHVRVRDTGVGIPENRREAIFESYTQADGSTQHRFGGTGLGLAISARLIGLMGGRQSAVDIFKKLGIDARTAVVTKDIARVEDVAKHLPATRGADKRTNSVVSQLLTVRLAEATASRELLFRELVAVLQQESNARKIIIAQYNDQKRLYPFITHGYSPQESNELVGKLCKARADGEEKAFARTKNIAVFQLRGSPAPPAVLIVSPQSGAVLSDDTSLAPLLSVVELGMNVVTLRERDNGAPALSEASGLASHSVMPGFIHSSPAMTTLVEEVYKIRSSDVTVLVTGESGTGKELVSRAIHKLSNRKDKIFVPFNCTAVPKELAEGHLFGYKKGAFTGAVADSPGTIRTADGGTLFLDEVGDLPLDIQPKILRFLQEGEIQPLGEKKPLKVDVRIIAATNMPLEEKVADGTFREDLYYRLNVIRLRVPPLRERRSEIPPIVDYYVNHYSQRFGKQNITFTPQTVDTLMVCNWEGNVRQLCNEIQRVIARAEDNDVVTPEQLSPELKRSAKPLTPFYNDSAVKPIASYDGALSPFANIPAGGTLEDAVSELEMQLIRNALARHNWNISRVATELGLTRRGLYLKLARYGIEKAV